MANRPQGEGLEGLTAERLDELALSCTNVADQREGQAIAEASWPDLAALLSAEAHDNRQLAALCRAVANAYKRIRASAEDGHDLCIGAIGDRGVCTYWLSNESDEPFAWAQHETLAAALASIHPEAGGTA